MRFLNLKLATLTLSLFTIVNTYTLANEEQVLNSDPIDINGYVNEPQVVDQELNQINSELKKQKGAIKVNKEKSKRYQELGRTTEKLADVTEEYINDKKESEEIISNYNQKIDCLLKENPGPECSDYVSSRKIKKDVVNTAAAAPVVEQEVAPSRTMDDLSKLQLALKVGAANFSGQVESLETEYLLKLVLESDINNYFTMDFGVGYMSFQTRDYADTYFNGSAFRYNYFDFYGRDGRNIEYTQWIFDVYGKFTLNSKGRFRPYIGTGLAFNRSKLRYTDNDRFNPGLTYYDYEFGNEEFVTSFISGNVMLGSDVLFTPSFGMNAEIGYSKSIGNMFNRERAFTPADAPDQERLEELAQDVTNAHIISVNIGLKVLF